ncbi:MAG: hypothetical protein EOO41_00390 [Methanobacteriota archaeon]|nr:MAG: hypothetical protein EOO41_00390 [Euryarchaeota archaeon]
MWDACKGDYRNFYVMLQGGGKTSSSGMGGDGEGGGMAGGGPTTGGGRKLGGGGPNAPGQSEAAMKRAAELNAAMQSASAGVLTTPLRASMLTQFLATFVTPRWKRWHSGDLRASMLSQGVGRLIFREVRCFLLVALLPPHCRPSSLPCAHVCVRVCVCVHMSVVYLRTRESCSCRCSSSRTRATAC